MTDHAHHAPELRDLVQALGPLIAHVQLLTSCCWPIFGRFCGRENRPYRPQTLSSGCALSKSPPGKTTTTRNATTSGGGSQADNWQRC